MTSYGPVFGLDNSTLTVRNGPALSLTNGTTMYVYSDFASLTNGSKITVQNGPLIYVSGSGSSLTVTGALVNFGGTGGNQLIVNNSFTPTGTTNGVPFRTETGGIVNIYTSTPIKNADKGTTSFTGSVIRATNYGYVTIGGGY